MTGVVDYYFAPISGYAYLGHQRLMEIAAEAGAEVRVKPVDIARVFAASETVPPFKQSAVRRNYRIADMARWGLARGLPVTPTPKHWPTPVGLACRTILVSPNPALAAQAMLKAVWAEERNIADMSDVVDALDGAGLNGEKIVAEAETGEAAARAETVTQEAIAKGVFGSPSYVVNGAVFWGQDRLDFVADALRQEAA